MKKRSKRLLLVLDLLLVLGLALGIGFYVRNLNEREKQEIGQETLERRFSKTISRAGQDYPLKRNLSAVLLIGTDNYIDDSKQNRIESFYNNNFADFLGILIFDHEARTVTPFQICRDTMCDVPWIAVNGRVGGTEVEQITYAHTYGTGREDSCENTRTAVEDLLYGVPIDHYISFTMETVPLMNDLVGGVTVRLEDDIPQLGPEYVKGATILLQGKDALRFVRFRDTSLVDDNLRRMGHQRQYLSAFTESARAAAGKDPELAAKAFKMLEKYLCTDLSVENVSDMLRWLCDYEIRPVLCPTGEYVMGPEYAEFYMDEDSRWSCVKTAFCA